MTDIHARFIPHKQHIPHKQRIFKSLQFIIYYISWYVICIIKYFFIDIRSIERKPLNRIQNKNKNKNKTDLQKRKKRNECTKVLMFIKMLKVMLVKKLKTLENYSKGKTQNRLQTSNSCIQYSRLNNVQYKW